MYEYDWAYEWIWILHGLEHAFLATSFDTIETMGFLPFWDWSVYEI